MENLLNEGKDDIILIGGPYTNPGSREAFKQSSSKLNITRFDNSGVTFTINSLKKEFSYDVLGDFKLPVANEREDIGIIVSYSSDLPSAAVGRRIIMAGCNTYGTAVAAHFLLKFIRD